MKRITFIKLITGIGILIAGAWYFVLKDYNYKITFTSAQAPGIIYTSLLQWNSWKNNDIEAVSTVSKTPFSEIRQQLSVADSVFSYRWIIKRKNDSVTRVTALIKDKKNNFLQNLQVPFYRNAFLKRNIATVKKVKDKLKANTKYYKVATVEKGSIPAVYCAYIPLSCKLREKGNTMIGNIHLVMDYIKGNAIALTGAPFLEITAWDLQEDTITFNFCFPVEERDDYPGTDVVKFKKTKARSALKTVFNGNYKISDSAWFTLIDYAQTHNIPIEKLPFEIYLNDPHTGGNELEWQAEVYMPLKN